MKRKNNYLKNVVGMLDEIKLMISKLLQNYFFVIKRKKLENALVDEILRLSSLPRNNDIQTILKYLSRSRNKIISFEFKNIYNKIKKGHKLRHLFKDLKKKYSSDLLNQFLDLILFSTTTGTVSISDYKNVVKNFLKSKELIDERKAMLLMQKYTIIIAGGFIVPGILGIVISLINKLGGTVNLSSLGIVTSSSLYSISYYCSIIYIVEYSIISSIYLSLLENNSKKSIIYLLFLLPVSLLMFFVFKFIL
jgi:hypothetical protein